MATTKALHTNCFLDCATSMPGLRVLWNECIICSSALHHPSNSTPFPSGIQDLLIFMNLFDIRESLESLDGWKTCRDSFRQNCAWYIEDLAGCDDRPYNLWYMHIDCGWQRKCWHGFMNIWMYTDPHLVFMWRTKCNGIHVSCEFVSDTNGAQQWWQFHERFSPEFELTTHRSSSSSNENYGRRLEASMSTSWNKFIL